MRQFQRNHWQAWLGGIPEQGHYPAGDTLSWQAPQPVFDERSSTRAAVMLQMEKAPYHFAFLGGTFIPSKTGYLEIEVAVSQNNTGLTADFAQSVFDRIVFSAYTDDRYPIGSGNLRVDRASYHPVNSSTSDFMSVAGMLYRFLNPRNQLETDAQISSFLLGGYLLTEKTLPGAIQAALSPLPGVAKLGQQLLLQWVEDELIGWFTDEYKSYVESDPPDITHQSITMLQDEAFARIEEGTVAEKITAYWAILSSQDEAAIHRLLAMTGWKPDIET